MPNEKHWDFHLLECLVLERIILDCLRLRLSLVRLLLRKQAPAFGLLAIPDSHIPQKQSQPYKGKR